MSAHIGINADSFTINGDLAVLDKFLGVFHEAGFSHAEIPVHGVDCILNGALSSERLRDTQKILRKYPLAYSVHAPDVLNLADPGQPDLQAAALRSTIDFAAEIEARIVVYHGSHIDAQGDASETQGDESRQSRSPDRVELCQKWADEIERLGRIARYAERRHVTVAVENIFRQSRREKTYRTDPRELACIVAAVDSPALGICFDFGHAFISANEEGFSIGDALCAVAPRLAHVHIHDNFGKPWAGYSRSIDAMGLGVGDLHLPPGWGTIPYDVLFPIFTRDYGGIFMLELQPRFRDKYPEAIAWVRSMLGS